MTTIEEDAYLAHYGVLRRSGRYPWGSGGPEYPSSNPDKRNKEFLDYVDELKAAGLSEPERAKAVGVSVAQLRAAKSVARNEYRLSQIIWAQQLKDKGMSNTAIGKKMGLNESSVRALLEPGAKDKADVLQTTANMLKAQVAEKTYLDVGTGQEHFADVSRQKLDAAISLLKEEGYETHTVKLQQPGTGFETQYKVLVPHGVTQRDVFLNRDKIQQIQSFSDDGGRTRYGLLDPISVDPKRVGINYKEDGGAAADGVIYVRRGVDDLSLGGASYAQVRIRVGEDHYLKGMAIYKDDLPKGVDLQFNTNKKDTGNKFDALKSMRDKDGNIDPDNPFGAVVRQLVGRDGKGNEYLKSAMNIVNEEGDWAGWAESIASQVLSKQSPVLAKKQLDTTYDRRKREFDEISALTNPTVKRHLLEKFADGTDSAAVHLKAAALPRSAWQVILPVPSIKDTEIYAPNFTNGERVALIRYPHGGTFEIPELTVNNRHPDSKRLLGSAKDAVGIHPKTAERLSGADFDGDTVLVIPNGSGKIRVSPALEGLKNFDPMSYKIPDGSDVPKITPRRKQIEMGKVSNLITDMTLIGAPHEHLARAVRHSMVVIDSEKHGLNFKQSEKDNGIKALKAEYQGGANKGAATLISRAGSEARLPQRVTRPAAEGGKINKQTGEIEYVPTNRMGANGKPRMEKHEKLAITKDARDLVSEANTPMERVYADHSNRLKALANSARLEAVNTPNLKYSPTSNKAYAAEVKTLDAKLSLAYRNKPLERQALVIAGTTIKARRDANPNMDEATLKKVKAQALNEARRRTGSEKSKITPTPEEWAAIQAGAISDSKLTKILNNADIDAIRTLATPRTHTLVSSSDAARAKGMLARGFTRAEVAAQLGVSLSTLDRSME